ncbi:hypothetical protein JXA12_00425 [Candidatus Woesearchaeota archaeon]|nr:hypothetical protein [Candidatus Woesearchaeota archaeon]
MIVEIAGLPRVGKTSVIRRLQEERPSLKVYLEVFSSIPFPDPTSFDYNRAYVDVCVGRAEEAWADSARIHVFDRGIIDRLAVSDALHRYGYLSGEEYRGLAGLLAPHAEKRDVTVVFNTSVAESLERIKRPKRHFSQDGEFLEALFSSYASLAGRYDRLVYIPASSSLEERARMVGEVIGAG